MQLTEEHRQAVAQWVAQGATLAEVQKRLGEEFDVRLTYMEARFLVDDLELKLQEAETKKPEAEADAAGPGAGAAPSGLVDESGAPIADETAGAAGGVQVSLDKIVRPGALVSGKVTFSDGVQAEWYLDQTGRFGLMPPTPEYRPSPDDMADFKIALERELQRQGL
ncbi:MAG TPA: hypothetical protein VNQ90_12785 [Chthoniobacteraceae bacterium]|nr:hypothetical protein [Chthoniobacteraceae bacterium]